jgi:hypothetical protein
MGALRDRMIEEMKLRNFSAATQKTYLYAVRRLVKHYGKAPGAGRSYLLPVFAHQQRRIQLISPTNQSSRKEPKHRTVHPGELCAGLAEISRRSLGR